MLVTAAFIGPGTVLTASQAGAQFGFSLLWTVIFATATGIILQEMASRLGIASGSGFSEAIRRAITSPYVRWIFLGLILLGIFLGNSAFQTGNLIGAASGVEVLQHYCLGSQLEEPSLSTSPFTDEQTGIQLINSFSGQPAVNVAALLVIGLLAGTLILIGKYEWLQRIMTVLVVFMSVLFLLAACLSWPRLGELAAGLVPRIPPNSSWLIIGLIGTTVVPYNLFLHASAAANRWPAETVRKVSDKEKAVRESASNTRIAVGIGGLITASIMITAAVAFEPVRLKNPEITEAEVISKPSDIAVQLKPVLGSQATLMFGLGLFAAGLTSAITAPVAAAYAVGGSFGWANQLTDWRLKAVALTVMLTGLGLALKFGRSPKEAVLTAQSLNGLLLPLLAVMLLVIVNRIDIMTRHFNRPLQNLVAVLAIGLVMLIAARQLVIFYAQFKNEFL